MRTECALLMASLAMAALLASSGAASEGAATAPLPAGPLAGSGEWQSIKGEGIGGTWTVTLTRSGDRVDGTLSLRGSNVFSGGRVSGTVNAGQVVLGVLTEAGKVASFTGLLDGRCIKGEWEAALIDDHGVWYGTLAPTLSDAEP